LNYSNGKTQRANQVIVVFVPATKKMNVDLTLTQKSPILILTSDLKNLTV